MSGGFGPFCKTVAGAVTCKAFNDAGSGNESQVENFGFGAKKTARFRAVPSKLAKLLTCQRFRQQSRQQQERENFRACKPSPSRRSTRPGLRVPATTRPSPTNRIQRLRQTSHRRSPARFGESSSSQRQQ